MNKEFEITCINKVNCAAPHESILNIGGRGWKLPVTDAIAETEKGEIAFYVNKAGKKIAVVIAKSESGNKYFKTTEDGVMPKNLLNLPECPY